MTIQKSIKTFLLTTLFISTLPYVNNAKAIRHNRRYTYIHTNRYSNRNTKEEILGSIIIVAGITAISAGLIGLAGYFAYNQGVKQCQLLESFRDNPYYDYQHLDKDARDQYYNQWSSSSTSLSNDYPVVWLEKSATSNKNFLSWIFFNQACVDLSRRLNSSLRHLRNIPQFQYEKKEYNERYREQSYRDERLSIEREKLNLKKENRKNSHPNSCY